MGIGFLLGDETKTGNKVTSLEGYLLRADSLAIISP